MSRNTMVAIVGLLLVALVGGVGAIWAYKKYKKKQNMEHKLEGAMPFSVKVGTLPEDIKKEMLSDALLDEVIEQHQLVRVWEVADQAAAKAKIREKFGVTIDGTQVKVTYQDKDRELTEKVLNSIAKGFIERMKKNVQKPVPTPNSP